MAEREVHEPEGAADRQGHHLEALLVANAPEAGSLVARWHAQPCPAVGSSATNRAAIAAGFAEKDVKSGLLRIADAIDDATNYARLVALACEGVTDR